MTHIFTTIAKLIDEDTEAYIRILLENPLDDDTRESVRGILMEAMSPKRTQIVCDCLFRIVAAINKQERKKQKHRVLATPPIASPPPLTNTIRPKTKNTHTTNRSTDTSCHLEQEEEKAKTSIPTKNKNLTENKTPAENKTPTQKRPTR